MLQTKPMPEAQRRDLAGVHEKAMKPTDEDWAAWHDACDMWLATQELFARENEYDEGVDR